MGLICAEIKTEKLNKFSGLTSDSASPCQKYSVIFLGEAKNLLNDPYIISKF